MPFPLCRPLKPKVREKNLATKQGLAVRPVTSLDTNQTDTEKFDGGGISVELGQRVVCGRVGELHPAKQDTEILLQTEEQGVFQPEDIAELRDAGGRDDGRACGGRSVHTTTGGDTMQRNVHLFGVAEFDGDVGEGVEDLVEDVHGNIVLASQVAEVGMRINPTQQELFVVGKKAQTTHVGQVGERPTGGVVEELLFSGEVLVSAIEQGVKVFLVEIFGDPVPLTHIGRNDRIAIDALTHRNVLSVGGHFFCSFGAKG